MTVPDIKNPVLKHQLQQAYDRNTNILDIPHLYAAQLFEFLTSTERMRYMEALPLECGVMLEHFGRYFALIKLSGYAADKLWFNNTILADLKSVQRDVRIDTSTRIQIIYAIGNLAYLIHLLEEFVNYPYMNDDLLPSE